MKINKVNTFILKPKTFDFYSKMYCSIFLIQNIKYHISGFVWRIESIKKGGRFQYILYIFYMQSTLHSWLMNWVRGPSWDGKKKSLRNQFSIRCSVKSTKMRIKRIQVFLYICRYFNVYLRISNNKKKLS